MRNLLHLRSYPLKKGRSGWVWLRWGLGCLLVVVVVAAASTYIWYSRSLSPVSTSRAVQLFPVSAGTDAHQIATDLQSLGLIRDAQAFVYYVDIHGYKDKLQAGTYNLSPSLSARVIAGMIARGEIDKNWITILPGKTLDQIQQAFKQVGYTDAQLQNAFNPANYSNEPLIAKLPPGASLEGLLYPDSFQRTINTPASDIVRESIEEMESKLTPDIVSGFKRQGLTTYQGITLASIVYQESGSPAYEPTVAQVFLLRLKKGMMLGSDVTAYYAAKLAGESGSLGVDSPYNTRLHAGLPPGPIGNMVVSALQAVAHPSNSSYLFFVAGDNGQLYFAYTEAQHEENIAKYCKIQCAP